MIYHAHSYYESSNAETKRRMNLARLTWSRQPWIDIPVSESNCRMFTDSIGSVPFVKDILNAACEGRYLNDIVVFTNSDTCVSENCSLLTVASLQVCDAAYCFRRDFARLESEIPDQDIKDGHKYCGTDFKAFRVSWWINHMDQFPDLLLGREAWDSVMRLMIDMTNYGLCPELQDLIYHERHPTLWENPTNRYMAKSQIHNIALARKWLSVNNIKYSTIGL